MGSGVNEKFCSSCRRYKPEHLIESKRTVPLLRGGFATHYLCGACAEKKRVRAGKKAVAHG